jgi:transposase
VGKTYRDWNVDQRWLLPPSVQELVPSGHAAHFVRDLVRESLDLSAILEVYDEERGQPPYHPVMMTALLLYAYMQGVYSSRKIARACETRVDFMAVTAMQKPDFRTVSDFRKRHLQALKGLFVQVLRLCRRAGMARLGHVALDGTKVRANASKHKAMSYERMKQTEAELGAEVEQWLRRAAEEDNKDDAEHGERRGDEMPAWVAEKEKRLARIREAKAALEAEAAQTAGEDGPKKGSTGGSGGAGGPSTGVEVELDKPAPVGPHARTAPRDGQPHPKAQRNFTDPESRVLKTSDGYIQGYNAQLAVDAGDQVIVACGLVNTQNDTPLLVPMLERIRASLRRYPDEISADSGFLSDRNLASLGRKRIRGYIATSRMVHGSPVPEPRLKHSKRVAAMRRRLKRGGYRSRYRLRKQVVEPVIGQIKEARGFRRFLLRGTENVAAEWALLCTAHNLVKLAQRQLSAP